VEGPKITHGELLDRSQRVAGALREAGVVPGDRVAIMVGNRPEFLYAYLAAAMLGAVSVPLNTALRGDLLEYVLQSVGPCRLVVEDDFAGVALPAADATGSVSAIWVVGAARPGVAAFGELLTGQPITESFPAQPWDLVSILFTSGTTGRSKGVMWSHATAVAFSENATWAMGYTADDVIYTCLPLFHINALFTAFFAGIQNDAPIVVSPRFSARRYWTEVTEYRATVTNMLGAIGAILWKQPVHPSERQHRLRLAMSTPSPAGYSEDFEERFGLRLTECYGSTDTGIPIAVPHGSRRRHGSCGVVAPGWEVDLVDEHDNPVGAMTAGELVTRPSRPFVGQLGYWNQPDKTWEAHRNAWFHTGDVLLRDEEGWFYFRGRVKDALRVSGENVSSFEVEQALEAHPDVVEVAVYGVPSELGEDCVMAAVVLKADSTLGPESLVDFVTPRLPYFAVPRYLRVVNALPKTSTQKILKQGLREEGIVPGTFDSGPRRRR